VRQKIYVFCILSIKKFYHGTNTSRTFSESRNVNRKENKYGAQYHPLPVVLDREKGFVWDVDGKKYYDSCLRILP
jgi:4-aminobutyrate aminotransferase-like enzyme